MAEPRPSLPGKREASPAPTPLHAPLYLARLTYPLAASEPKMPAMYSAGPFPSSYIIIACTQPLSTVPPEPPPLGKRGLLPTCSQFAPFLRNSDPCDGLVKSPPAYSFIPSPRSKPPIAEITVAVG